MTAARVKHPSEFILGPYDLVSPELLAPAAVDLLPGTRSYLNLRYARPAGWRPLLGDLHVPSSGSGPHPVVVYCHGGSFLVGDKDMEPGPWTTLPSRGIAVFTVDYRLAGEVAHPEAVEDVLAAVRWTRAHAERYDLDPVRVAGWGSSAGGYLVGRAAFADGGPVARPVGEHREVGAELSAAVLHYPVTDFSTVLDDAFEPTAESQQGVVDVVSRYLGSPMLDDPERLRASSLAHAATAARHRPPVLLQHGDADHRSGVGQSRRFRDALVALGGDAVVDVVEGEDHATAAFASPRVVDTVVDFLERCWASADVG